MAKGKKWKAAPDTVKEKLSKACRCSQTLPAGVRTQRFVRVQPGGYAVHVAAQRHPPCFATHGGLIEPSAAGEDSSTSLAPLLSSRLVPGPGPKKFSNFGGVLSKC